MFIHLPVVARAFYQALDWAIDPAFSDAGSAGVRGAFYGLVAREISGAFVKADGVAKGRHDGLVWRLSILTATASAGFECKLRPKIDMTINHWQQALLDRLSALRLFMHMYNLTRC